MKRNKIVVSMAMVLLMLGGMCSGDEKYSSPMPRGTKGAVTMFVASDTAPASVRKVADFVCDGTDDQVQINAAIQQMTGGGAGNVGGQIKLSEGVFVISSPIVLDRGFRFEGISGGTTIISLADGADCNMIDVTAVAEGNTIPLSVFQHFQLDGNENNQSTQPDRTYTSKTGTDASPSVINMGFPALGGMVLTGRQVALSGTDCTPGYYTIVSNTSQFITLDRNASTGGLMTGLNVEIDQLYGIYQHIGDGQIDIRFIDVWFEKIQGHGISLGKYWNHRIERCVFEHMEGAGIEFRLGEGIEGVTITNCFGLLNDHFIKIGGYQEGEAVSTGARNVVVSNNTMTDISGTGKDLIEIGGGGWNIHDNILGTSFATDNTYSAFVLDTDRLGFDVTPLTIHDNILRNNHANNPKYVFHAYGDTYWLRDVHFQNNNMNAAAYQTAGFSMNFPNIDPYRIIIQGNSFIGASGADGVVIEADDAYYVLVQNNIFLCQGDGNGVDCDANEVWQHSMITGNRFIIATGKPIVGSPKLNSLFVYIADNACGADYGGSYQRSAPTTPDKILNGQTTIVITHDLDIIPVINRDIIVWPIEDMGNATHCWVSAATTTTFTISVDADPGKDVEFGWRIVSESQY